MKRLPSSPRAMLSDNVVIIFEPRKTSGKKASRFGVKRVGRFKIEITLLHKVTGTS
jgi:hypothetical protein